MVRLALLLLAVAMTLGLQPMVAFADEVPTYDVRPPVVGKHKTSLLSVQRRPA